MLLSSFCLCGKHPNRIAPKQYFPKGPFALPHRLLGVEIATTIDARMRIDDINLCRENKKTDCKENETTQYNRRYMENNYVYVLWTSISDINKMNT